jgi:hypothetical protein
MKDKTAIKTIPLNERGSIMYYQRIETSLTTDVWGAARLAWNADRARMAAVHPDWPMPAWSRAPAWRRRPYILDPRPGTSGQNAATLCKSDYDAMNFERIRAANAKLPSGQTGPTDAAPSAAAALDRPSDDGPEPAP